MTLSFEKIKAKALRDPNVKAEYDALEETYKIIEALITARNRVGLSQEEVAKNLGTTQSAVARLESGRVTPTLKTLFKYARATGLELVIGFKPTKRKTA